MAEDEPEEIYERETATCRILIEDIHKVGKWQTSCVTNKGTRLVFGVAPRVNLPSLFEACFVYVMNPAKKDTVVQYTVSVMREIKGVEMKLYSKEITTVVTHFAASYYLSHHTIADHAANLTEVDLLYEMEILRKQPQFTDIRELPETLSHDLGALLTNRKNCDVVFRFADGKELQAHKLILSARCPVFAAMFEHETKEKLENSVYIDDVASDVFEELLRFLYTGTVKEVDRFAAELLMAADKYQLKSLKKLTENYLSSHLTNETVSQLLLLADMHQCRRLKRKAMDHISDNHKMVKKTDGWDVLSTKADLMTDLFLHLADKYHDNFLP